MNRRSQSRRSSNTLPIRIIPGGNKPSNTSTLSTSAVSSAQKRSSSIPRPSIGSSVSRSLYGSQTYLATGTTPSKGLGSSSRHLSSSTPQIGGTTPQQSRGNNMSILAASGKPYQKETRNLSDKNCVVEMMKNVADFLTHQGYPEYVSFKEIQKIDKQSFVKYFNFIYQFMDSNFQLAPRFNEDELLKNMKEFGYCGTLAKSALVSIGALHSTGQIIGMLSWMADFVRMAQSYEEEENTVSYEKAELRVMMQGYNAWCRDDQSFDLKEEFVNLYKEKHQFEDGKAEMIERQIKAITDECRIIERKSSQIEELRAEAKKEERRLEDLQNKEVQLHQRSKEHQNEEKHLLQNLEEIKEKTALNQKEIAELVVAAKNCKVSAEDARRIKAEIANNKRDYAAAMEQREQVCKLVEKREMQKANISAEDVKIERELNVNLMDMGMTVSQEDDRKEGLKWFLDQKTAELSELENRCIAMTEGKERILAEISQSKMELKHNELLRNRLEEKLISIKTDRDEMERLYLSQLAELESLSASAPRSDPLLMRQQYELETLQKKNTELIALMNRQEKELQDTIETYAAELKNGDEQFEIIKMKVIEYLTRLAEAQPKVIEGCLDGSVTLEMLPQLIPEPNF